MSAARPKLFIALLCGLAAGCAATGPFPSLAPRPEELNHNQPAPPASVPPAVALDPALATRLDGLLADARRGDSAFQAELAVTERMIAASGAAGSDSWAEAQQALSRLEAARTPTTAAAAELDALARARIDAAPSTAEADVGVIGATVGQVRELVERQDGIIARLSGALPTL